MQFIRRYRVVGQPVVGKPAGQQQMPGMPQASPAQAPDSAAGSGFCLAQQLRGAPPLNLCKGS